MRSGIFVSIFVIMGEGKWCLSSIEAFHIMGHVHTYKTSYSSVSKMHMTKSGSDQSIIIPFSPDKKINIQRRNRFVSFIIERFGLRPRKSFTTHRSPPEFSRIHIRSNNNLDERQHQASKHLTRVLPSIISNRQFQKKKSTVDIPNNTHGYEHNKTSKTLLDWIINLILNSQTFEPAEDLTVSIKPMRTMIPRLVIQGQFHGDLTIQFKKVYFPALRITGGGMLKVKSIRINFYSWIPPPVTSTVQQVLRLGDATAFHHRFPSPFKLQAYDVSLTSDDLLQSSCIRIGLRNLFRRILKSLSYFAPKDVMVQSVYILVCTLIWMRLVDNIPKSLLYLCSFNFFQAQ